MFSKSPKLSATKVMLTCGIAGICNAAVLRGTFGEAACFPCVLGARQTHLHFHSRANAVGIPDFPVIPDIPDNPPEPPPNGTLRGTRKASKAPRLKNSDFSPTNAYVTTENGFTQMVKDRVVPGNLANVRPDLDWRKRKRGASVSVCGSLPSIAYSVSSVYSVVLP